MRTLLGWLILFGLAALAGWGTAHWRAQARTQGESVTKVSEDELPGVPARILIGAPSGAAPIQREAPTPADLPLVNFEEELRGADQAPSPPVTPAPASVLLTVRPGSTLSGLCQEFYADTDRPPLTQLVEAVSRWNGLASPNDLRAGQVLELPPLSSLFP